MLNRRLLPPLLLALVTVFFAAGCDSAAERERLQKATVREVDGAPATAAPVAPGSDNGREAVGAVPVESHGPKTNLQEPTAPAPAGAAKPGDAKAGAEAGSGTAAGAEAGSESSTEEAGSASSNCTCSKDKKDCKCGHCSGAIGECHCKHGK